MLLRPAESTQNRMLKPVSGEMLVRPATGSSVLNPVESTRNRVLEQLPQMGPMQPGKVDITV